MKYNIDIFIDPHGEYDYVGLTFGEMIDKLTEYSLSSDEIETLILTGKLVKGTYVRDVYILKKVV